MIKSVGLGGQTKIETNMFKTGSVVLKKEGHETPHKLTPVNCMPKFAYQMFRANDSSECTSFSNTLDFFLYHIVR